MGVASRSRQGSPGKSIYFAVAVIMHTKRNCFLWKKMLSNDCIFLRLAICRAELQVLHGHIDLALADCSAID